MDDKERIKATNVQLRVRYSTTRLVHQKLLQIVANTKL